MTGGNKVRLIVAAGSAACGLIVEIVAGRMVAPYLGMSLYTWTAIISVVLAGFSLGHWIGGRLAERPRDRATGLVIWSLVLAAISTAVSLVLIRYVAPLAISFDLGLVPTILLITTALFFLPSVFVGIPSPVLTKLAVDESDATAAGRTIGAFFAAGAVGSIVGSLSAGFVLIPWIGIASTLLAVAAAYLLLALVLASTVESSMRRTLLLRVSAVVFAGAAPIALFGSQIQAFADPCRTVSAYYCIRVVDVSRDVGRPARALVLDHLGHGVNLRDAPKTLVSPYVELQDILARIHSGRRSPFKAFFIGGGAYTLPRAWLAARPDALLTVAEIDPAVTKLAHAEMWLPAAVGLRTVHLDARMALQAEPLETFDVIVGDAFHDIVVPPHLVTREFFELAEERLASDGIYLMNIVDHRSHPRLAMSVRATLQKAFPIVELWGTSGTGVRATFVLAALRKATPYAKIPSRASPGVTFVRLDERRLRQWNQRLAPLVLTDDHAPVVALIGVQ